MPEVKYLRSFCQLQQKRNTHTHTQPFYSSLDFVRDNPGKLLPEGTFCHLLDFMVQNEDITGRHTNNPDEQKKKMNIKRKIQVTDVLQLMQLTDIKYNDC